jgi:hypothetical protein
MKKFVFVIIFVISLASLSFGQVGKEKSVEDLKAQVKTFKNKRGFVVEYDRFEDVTSVYYNGFELMGFGESVAGILSQGSKSEEPPSLELKAGFAFKTNKLTTNVEKIYLAFTSSDTEWRFLKNRELIAIADNERIRFGEGDRDSDVKIGTGFALRESLAFTLTREELRKISNAKSLEIKIGGREQTLKDKHKQMLKDMLALATVTED